MLFDKYYKYNWYILVFVEYWKLMVNEILIISIGLWYINKLLWYIYNILISIGVVYPKKLL